MSRIREELDHMAGGPVEVPSGREKSTFPTPSLQERLDARLRELQSRSGHLSARLRDAGAPSPAYTAVRVPVHREAGELDTNDESPELSRIRARLEQLADKLNTANQPAAEKAPPTAPEKCATHSRQSAHPQPPEMPQAPQNEAGQLKVLSDELHAVREAMEQMLVREPDPVDLSSISQSIQSGYAEIVSMLESHFDRVSCPDDSLNTRLEEVGNAMARLAGNGPDALPHQFQVIEERLDELTRAIVAVSVNPSGHEDSIHRLEARLTELTRLVDEVAQASRQLAIEQALPQEMRELAGFPEEMRGAFQQIESHLAMMEDAGKDSGRLTEELVAGIFELSAKLDNMLHSGSIADSDAAAIAARFDAIDVRLEELANSVRSQGGGVDGETLQLIESQLAAINNQLENFQPSADGGLSAEREAELLSILQGLTSKIEAFDVQANKRTADESHLPGLEAQLSAIAARLDTISSAGADIGPVEQRLESIEQEIALSRDMAIDVASQAAEQALRASGDTASSDQTMFDSLIRELRNLESQAQDMNKRNFDGFAALNQTMDRISSRLDVIESGYLPPVAEPAAVKQSVIDREYSTVERSAHEPGCDEIDSSGDAETHTATGDIRDGDFADQEDAIPERDENDEEFVQALSSISDAPSLGTPIDEALFKETDDREMPHAEAVAAPEIEDVPLEPGSGVPDLAALVRHASEKRKSGQFSASRDSIAEILNDARRAAKAAAIDAAAASNFEEEQKARKKLKVKRSLTGMLKKRAKLLIITAAFIAVAAACTPLAFRYLQTGAGVKDTSAPTSDIGSLSSPQQLQMATERGDGGAVAIGDREDGTVIESADRRESQSAFETSGSTVPPESAESAVSAKPETLAHVKAASSVPVPGVAERTADRSDQTILSGTAEGPIEPGRMITFAPMPPVEIGNVVLRQAAAEGDGRALFEVARRYTDGDGVERDLAKAASWYELAATAGYPPAQYRYANFLEKGHGGNSDIKGAAKWYEKAAQNGNALAMHNLAVLYSSGLLDGAPNMTEAVAWFGKAANLGVKDSQVNLGILSAQGFGVTKDLSEAYKWFAIAARGGDTDAASKRDSLANSLRPDQIAEARGAAEIWTPNKLDPGANTPSVPPEWKRESAGQATLEERDMIVRTQELLARQGFDPGPADGLMGERTREAIRLFERRAGMTADGEVTAELLKRLEDSSV